MDKIIVYGLGNYFKEYEEEIRSKYDVVAVSDSNVSLADKYDLYIEPYKISEREFDYVMICSIYDAEIANYLIQIGIDKDKIILPEQIMHLGARHSFAQDGEDLQALVLLSLMGRDVRNISYLELGTNHPIRINNTYLFYLLGGHGVLVEPNKSLKNLIEIMRPQDSLIDKAVSLDGKPGEFIEFKYSPVSTMVKERLDEDYCSKENDFQIKDKYMVETITINELLHLQENVPDLLSIDIEGMDYAILSQIDFESTRPAVIIVELNARGQKESDENKICSLLEYSGYKLFFRNSANGIYYDSAVVGKIPKSAL